MQQWFVELVVAVLGLGFLKNTFEVASPVLHGQVCERMCEKMVKVPGPQVAEQFVARVVAVKRRRQCAYPGHACLL